MLTIPADSTFTVEQGAVVNNYGTITNNGTVVNNGVINTLCTDENKDTYGGIVNWNHGEEYDGGACEICGKYLYTSPTPNMLTANKDAQELLTAGTTVCGEWEYALGTDDVTVPETGWSTEIPTATEAGTYYVWYRIPAGEGYAAVEAACFIVTVSEQVIPSVPFIPWLESFVTTTGQFNEQAYYCRNAKVGDTVLLKVSTSEIGDSLGLD